MTGDAGREGGGDGSGGQLSVGGGDGDGGGGGGRRRFLLPIAIFSRLICSLGVCCVPIVVFQSFVKVIECTMYIRPVPLSGECFVSFIIYLFCQPINRVYTKHLTPNEC